MKDSQLLDEAPNLAAKYIKESNERLSIRPAVSAGHKNSKQLLKDS